MAKTLTDYVTIAGQRPLNEVELGNFNKLNVACAFHAAGSGSTAMSSESYAGGAGFDAVLGICYTHLSRGEVRAELAINTRHHQPWGIVNGGVYCAVAESVASLAGIIASQAKPVAGVNNDTNFIRSMSTGVLEAVARPLQIGRRTQVWEVEMTNGGALIAKSTVRTMVL